MTTAVNMSQRRGVVALLDVLGVKGIWRQEGFVERVRKYEKIADTFEELITDSRNVCTDGDYIYPAVDFKVQAISDTIVITGMIEGGGEPIPDAGALVLAGLRICGLFIEALKSNIPLRGCIGCGELFRSDRMIVGPAVDEAAQEYDKSEWVGVSATTTAYQAMAAAQKDGPFHKDLFLPYKIPLDDGNEKDGSALNWPSYFGGSGELSELRTIIAAQLNHDDPQVTRKWKNTMDFFEAQTRS